MRVVILADGESAFKPQLGDKGNDTGSNWHDHTGVPKHLVTLEGEVLLERTVRQWSRYGEVVIVNGTGDPRYEIPNSEVYVPNRRPEFGDLDMFVKTIPTWPPDDRLVLLYGDVWFSDECVSTVAEDPTRDWRVYGRSRASNITGTPWGEQWAISLYPEHYLDAVRWYGVIHDAFLGGKLARSSPWEWYQAMEGFKVGPLRFGPHWVEVDDWTNDFDFAWMYEEWKKRRADRRML